MKKWKCQACGYIHTGEEPPETCPVCGADRSQFVELSAEEVKRLEAEGAAAPAGASQPGEAKAVAEKAAAKTDLAAGKPLPGWLSGWYGFITRQMVKNHAHPMTVHIPNGVLPAAVLFLVLATILRFFNFLQPRSDVLARVSFYNLLLFSGYIDWKGRFHGIMTRVIMTKIICGFCVFGIGIALIIMHVFFSEVSGVNRWTYLLVHFLMLAFAAYAGYLGGRLVFKD
jgi:hypothetical protein